MRGAMGPERGTAEYEQQVGMLKAQMSLMIEDKSDVDKVILMYVTDTSLSRSAIMEAIGHVEREKRFK